MPSTWSPPARPWLAACSPHPYPVIVACPGHAVAKGAFLLLSADYRIGVDGPFQIGLNEVAIGMTMHHVGIELARDRLRKSAFTRSVINAEMFSPAAAVDAGFLDTLVSADQLQESAACSGPAVEETQHDRASQYQASRCARHCWKPSTRRSSWTRSTRAKARASEARLVPGFLRPIITYYAKVTLPNCYF